MTLDEQLTGAQAQYADALTALLKIRGEAQQYHIYGPAGGGGRMVLRAALEQAEASELKWRTEVARLNRAISGGGGIRIRQGVPW